jgi:hypothetical protein
MNTSKHPRYTQQALFDAKKFGVDYTFGFGTNDPLDLNIEGHDFLLQGYWMNLASLCAAQRPLSAAIDTTPQVETLYHASKLVDLLWIEWDTQADEITGTWRADK